LNEVKRFRQNALLKKYDNFSHNKKREKFCEAAEKILHHEPRNLPQNGTLPPQAERRFRVPGIKKGNRSEPVPQTSAEKAEIRRF
jgi:hypothetical protein